ncbi:hypothetical protein FVB32_15585 [Flagellimonas hymeniacidonis]|uniref:Sulfotransferase domain-containing protein n=1 Tax=Flagellimonas hymeniacidonis TaxID=2603628 RepID=A0A5C8V3R6_9FLAO|nr:hypothetical protein [Flagellimonas hymeniacidonis]TXN35981.1 hypothetical protein FVB32_15585 [Flagellimonas hymeniacidonis]
MNFKKLVLSSPLAKLAKNSESVLDLAKMNFKRYPQTNSDTVYLISPFKTGTYYLSSCYKSNYVRQQPMQYLSLQRLDRNFDKFFKKRKNFLNLKLECSGFWSAYLEELSRNDIAKNLTYVCILRSPSKWINSVINYWGILDYLKFDYLNELFWRNKVGVDLTDFLKKDEASKQLIINTMLDFYMDFTKKTALLDKVVYIDLNKIDEQLPIIDKLIGLDSEPKIASRNKNKAKKFEYVNEEIDSIYKELTDQLRNPNKMSCN